VIRRISYESEELVRNGSSIPETGTKPNTTQFDKTVPTLSHISDEYYYYYHSTIENNAISITGL